MTYTLSLSVIGLLGVLTTIVLMYLGVYAGRVMLCFPKTQPRVIRWLSSATLFVSVNPYLYYSMYLLQPVVL
jgi:hypothetical protein